MNKDPRLLISQARKILVENFGSMSVHDARSEGIKQVYNLLHQADLAIADERKSNERK